ncbi:putative MFS sugar transporter [Aspergillus keveii]|uniref:MFS sugar transporter n=1 Tax=Aspergillus keveii TaxID=714993 RepID=A0ABR4FZT7_9EURO
MSEPTKFSEDPVAVAHLEYSQLDHGNDKVPQSAIARFTENEKLMSTRQAVKMYRRVLLFSLVPFLCGMTYGYDTVASSATMAMPAFLLSFGATNPATDSLYAPSLWSALWTALTNLGQAIGSFVMGFVAQRIGRRYAIASCCLVSAAGVAVQYTASTRWALLVGKIIGGFSIGGLLALGTTYASDIAPIRLRGPILQGLVFFTVLMQGTALGVIRGFVPDMAPRAWKMVFAIQWIVAGLPLLVLLIPESPVWLLSKGRLEDARQSLIRIYGIDNNIDIRLQLLQQTLEMEDNSSAGDTEASFLECFRTHNLKRTMTVCMMLFGIGMTGVAFLNQNTYFLLTLGLPAVHAFDIGIGGFFLACLVIAGGWFLNDRIGRRRLWLTGLMGNVVGMSVVGGLGFVHNNAGLWAVAVLMNLLIPWQLYACTGTAWTIAPEISSYRLRQYTQSLSYLVQALSNYIFHMIVPYLYNTDSADLGAKTGFVFAGLSACLFVVSWFLVPDTTGLSIEEIDRAYRERVSPRKFSVWAKRR